MHRKLVLLFVVFILAFVILLVRITYINAVKGGEYKKTVLQNQTYNNTIIPYKRGDIVDRNGTKLATSERIYHVILDVYVMTSDEEFIEPTIEVLEDVFYIEEEDVREVMEAYPESRYQILKKGVSYQMAQEFEAILDNTEEYPNVKGVWLESDYKRYYPYGSLAADLIGFLSADNQGAYGIESSYNDALIGTDGRKYGYFDSISNVEWTVKAAKNGDTVVSTIDVVLQSIVEDCILAFNKEHEGEEDEDALGSKNTAVIMMNPNTGEILAEASYPTFDLNNRNDLEEVYGKEQVAKMSEEEENETLLTLWNNYCVSDTFEAGSTIKPFTIANGLETGVLTGDETYTCEGYLQVEDREIACHLTSGHGKLTLKEAMAVSCNVALMEIVEKIGASDFSKYQHIFGFGEYTGIDLPGEVDTSSLLYSEENLNPAELATCSFGQGFNVTMTQLAAGFASLINGGYYYEPHVVKQIEDESGNVKEVNHPVLLRKTISSETSTQLKEYMREVMVSGTGQAAQVDGYEIGGKTGTAEKLPRGNEKYVLSYVGYAPQENPEILIYVVIDEPNVEKQDNSAYVLSLAKAIMEEAFPYLNITKMDTP
jgi:stage V sporulation protein D (sporulation-specific penicillin-binding protein)